MEVCESQRNVSDLRVWCGEPAAFMYVGPQFEDKRHKGKYLAPTELKLCMEHAHELYMALEPYYVRGDITITPLNGNPRLSGRCTACGQGFRVEKLGDEFNTLTPKFCPCCGTQTIVKPDFETDYWEQLSRQFDNMNHQLLRLLFEEWVDKRRFRRFKDFVAYAIKAYAE